MKKLLGSLIFFSCFFAEDVEKLSESIGHIVAEKLQSLPIDPDALAKGVREEQEGKIAPLSKEECLKLLNAALAKQKDLFKKEAEKFLEENKKAPNIISLSPKLQYRIEKEGIGSFIQEAPVIVTFTIKTLKGKILESASKTLLDPTSTIKGIRIALQQMKIGEKRMLFLHPDLAFQRELVLCEIEILDLAKKTSPLIAE